VVAEDRGMKGIHIRQAKHKDIPSLRSLLQVLFTIEVGFEVDEEKQTRALGLLLAREDALVLAAEDGGKVVGMCSVQTLISTARGGEVGFLEDLVVSPGSRRQGIGTLLLEWVCTWARQRGLTRLQLLADLTNEPALDFYERQGWFSTGFIGLRKEPV
jgi:GNAT superfamily N-acetyltransferase